MKTSNGLLIYWIPIALVGLILILALWFVRPLRGGRGDPHATLMVQVLDLVEGHYVEEKSREQLVHDAIRGVVDRLDRHSAFLDQAESRAADEENEGRFGGLGIHISTDTSKKNRALTVTRPFREGPAMEAGILPGDRVIGADGDRFPPVMDNQDLARILARLKGPIGSPVTLEIERGEGESIERLTRTLKRRQVNVDSVLMVRMVDPKTKIGYFRISAFREHTVKELDRALDDLMEQGLRGLVIDLRNNGGGLLRRSVEIADRFLGAGLVVTTRGRHDEDTEKFFSTDVVRVPEQIPVVVLINGGSASASEALAGALQDYRRAVIVGERSYGKGVVQSVYKMLRSQTSLKITTSHYYTPSGRRIERRFAPRSRRFAGGIIPDVLVVLTNEEETEITREGGEWDRWLADQVDPRTPPPPPVLPDSIDHQLASAIALLRGERPAGRTIPRKPKRSGRRTG